MWTRPQWFRRDLAGIEIGVLRRVKVRRVALHDSRLNGFCERGVGPFPRAPKGCDRAIDRVGLEAWECLAVFAELHDLPSSKSYVRAWREHRRGRGSCVRREAGQP